MGTEAESVIRGKQPAYGILLVTGKQSHQENYAPWFDADARCGIVAVSDEADVHPRRAALNREMAVEYGVPYIENLKDALAREDIDVVSVCAEPERRGRILVRCARAGKHLYIDKPMTPYRKAAEDVVSAVEASGVYSQMYSFVSKGWARRAKAVLSEGNLGDLLAVHADWFFAKGRPVREGLGATGSANLRKGHQPEVPPSQFTFHDSKAEFYAVGVYALGLVTWLAGRRVKSVYGFTRNYFFAEHQKNGQEDFGAFALTLEDGVRATVTGGRTGWSSHPGSGVNHLYVQGTMGNLRADGNAPRIECYTDQSPWRPPEIHPDDPMGFWKSTQQAVGVEPKGNWLPLDVEANERNDVSRFIDRLETGRNGEIDARAASHLTKVILAAYQSTATGEVVEVD